MTAASLRPARRGRSHRAARGGRHPGRQRPPASGGRRCSWCRLRAEDYRLNIVIELDTPGTLLGPVKREFEQAHRVQGQVAGRAVAHNPRVDVVTTGQQSVLDLAAHQDALARWEDLLRLGIAAECLREAKDLGTSRIQELEAEDRVAERTASFDQAVKREPLALLDVL